MQVLDPSLRQDDVIRYLSLLCVSMPLCLRGPSGFLSTVKRIRHALAAGGLAFLSGCATSPTPSFYTLSATAPQALSVGRDYSIGITAVTLSPQVDRPQLVLRVDDNRVVLDEQHRWAEPLRSDLGRVVAENLSRLLGQQQVVAYPHGAGLDPDYRVQIDAQRFELRLGEAAALDAVWSVRAKAGDAVSTGRTLAEEAAAPGQAAAVAAMSRAAERLSGDIAAAIRALRAKRR